METTNKFNFLRDAVQKKYVLLLDDYRIINGHKVFRVMYLMDIPRYGVTKYSLGGYIESYENLSQYWDCCVLDEAAVYGGTHIAGNACISDHAEISGGTINIPGGEVGGKLLPDETRCGIEISGGVTVSGNATVTGFCTLSGYGLHVGGNSRIAGLKEYTHPIQYSYDAVGESKIRPWNKPGFQAKRLEYCEKYYGVLIFGGDEKSPITISDYAGVFDGAYIRGHNIVIRDEGNITDYGRIEGADIVICDRGELANRGKLEGTNITISGRGKVSEHTVLQDNCTVADGAIVAVDASHAPFRNKTFTGRGIVDL